MCNGAYAMGTSTNYDADRENRTSGRSAKSTAFLRETRNTAGQAVAEWEKKTIRSQTSGLPENKELLGPSFNKTIQLWKVFNVGIV